MLFYYFSVSDCKVTNFQRDMKIFCPFFFVFHYIFDFGHSFPLQSQLIIYIKVRAILLLLVVGVQRIVGCEMQTSALFALQCPTGDEIAHIDHISQFTNVS